MSCVLIDVNKLKEINDAYGHQKGDEILKKLGQLILRNCRESDILVRWGGDEFLLLLPETGEEQARNLMKRIIGQSGEVTFSYGVVNGANYNSITEAVAAADKKLYSAKSRTLFSGKKVRG